MADDRSDDNNDKLSEEIRARAATMSTAIQGILNIDRQPSDAEVRALAAKMQREEDEAAMDVDIDDDAEMDGDGEGDWMDVDGVEAPKLKKAKANSGATIAKGARHPRSNRQLAGMRDEAVSALSLSLSSSNRHVSDTLLVVSNTATYHNCAVSNDEERKKTSGRSVVNEQRDEWWRLGVFWCVVDGLTVRRAPVQIRCTT